MSALLIARVLGRNYPEDRNTTRYQTTKTKQTWSLSLSSLLHPCSCVLFHVCAFVFHSDIRLILLLFLTRFSTRTRDSFSRASFTRRLYGFGSGYIIIRCTHTTTLSIMAMMAVYHILRPSFTLYLFFLPTLPARSFCLFAAARSADPSYLFPRFPPYARTFKMLKCDKAAEHPSEQCWIERSLIYDSVWEYRVMKARSNPNVRKIEGGATANKKDSASNISVHEYMYIISLSFTNYVKLRYTFVLLQTCILSSNVNKSRRASKSDQLSQYVRERFESKTNQYVA